jgi:hypothetical protein
VTLAGDGVLVCFDGVRGGEDGLCRVGACFVVVYVLEEGQKGGVVCVNCGDDGEVVLVFVEVMRSGAYGVVERIF